MSKTTEIQLHDYPKVIQQLPFEFWGIISCFILLGCLYPFLQAGKGDKLGRARLATKAEVKKSRNDAIKAINKPYEMTMWCGTPSNFCKFDDGTIRIDPHPDTVVFRHANEHMMVYGGTGAGKSRWLLDQWARSGILQGLAGIWIDLKGDEKPSPTSKLAGYALEHGYEIFTISPGAIDSDCLNLVELLESTRDLLTASELGIAISENGLADGDKPSDWTQSGGQFIAAGILYARALEQGADIATVQKFLGRLAADPAAIREAVLTQMQKGAFDEFQAAVGSPATAASVAFSAIRMLTRIMLPEVTAVFCRKTTIPIVLKPKQLLIFRIDPKNAKSVLPLVSAAIEVILKRNIYSGLGTGGFCLFDEIPQYRLPSIHLLAAVARSKKWAFAFGAQGERILEDSYGKARAAALLENCGTVVLMKLNSNETAKNYAASLGKEDARTKSKTESKNASTSTQTSSRDLVPVERLKKLRKGQAYVLSPGIEAKINGEIEVQVPYLHQFKLNRADLAIIKRSEQNWHKYLPTAIARCRARPLSENELLGRELMVASLLPESKAKQKQSKHPKEVFDAYFSQSNV